MSVVQEKENAVDIPALKIELKTWENKFIETNGRKPARADMRADATIAAKYKLYDSIVRPSRSAAPASTPKKSTRHTDSRQALREKTSNGTSATPKKTPSKAKPLSGQLLVPSPVQEEVEPTPAHIRAGLGPTPQKNGIVLGIFDTLPGETPCKNETKSNAETTTVVAGTPSKPTPTISDIHFSRTPQSSGKRFFLDAFAGTPLKRKRDDEPGTSSSMKRRFATPAFLRRSNPLAKIDEEGNDPAPTRPPFRTRTLGKVRSLSNMIQNLKNQQEKDMDDEWDIMREIEEEQEEGPEEKKAPPKVLVEDSQPTEMPLGPDQAPESSEESAAEGEGIVRKPWKKKGLKRQTRRTNMKPVLHKAKKAEELEPGSDEDDLEVVAETQPQHLNLEGDHQDDAASDGEKATTKKKGSKKKSTAKEDKEKDKEKEKKPRKFNPNATSHANFRTLKIKNKNSKAGGRRFGRR